MAQQLGRAPRDQEEGLSEVTLAHFYRAEVQRSTAWRTRLDTTTNWAITATAAIVSFTFTSTAAPHPTLLVGVAIIFTFLLTEARRYRYYDLWARRVRLIESGFLAPRLRREPVSVDFHAALAHELMKPRLRISALASLAFRLQRSYATMFVILLLGWVVKLDIHPAPARSFSELVARAQVGPVPALLVWAGWAACLVFIFGLLVYGKRAPLPPTELRAPARRTGRLAEAFQAVGPRGQVRMGSEAPVIRPVRHDET